MSFLGSSYIDAKYMHTCLHAEDIHYYKQGNL